MGEIMRSEVFESQEGKTKSKELKNLNFMILKNQEEFQRLANNPSVKSGMKKIFERSSQMAFSKEWEQYEKMDIQKELTSLIRKYPGLRLEISGILKLPIGKKKFSDLTMEQKLNFTLLQRALHPSKFQKLLTYSEPNTAKNIIKNFENAKSGLSTNIEDQFQKMNLKHFWVIKKTLATEFWLTDSETIAVTKYLSFLKENPQFTGKRVEYQAGWRELTIGLLVGSLLTLGGVYLYNELWKPNPHQETTENSEVITISDPRDVFRMMVQERRYKQTSKKKLEKYKIDNNTEGWRAMAERGYKKAANFFQTKEFKMGVNATVWLEYDLTNPSDYKMWIDPKDWVLHAVLPKPKPRIVKSDAFITERSNEIMQVYSQEFDNAEPRTQKELEKSILEAASKDVDFYREAHKNTRDILRSYMNSFKELHKIEIKNVDVTWK